MVNLMIVKQAIELKDKYFTGEQYSTTKPYYVGNPGDVLATMVNDEQCLIAKKVYDCMVTAGLAPKLGEVNQGVKFN